MNKGELKVPQIRDIQVDVSSTLKESQPFKARHAFHFKSASSSPTNSTQLAKGTPNALFYINKLRNKQQSTNSQMLKEQYSKYFEPSSVHQLENSVQYQDKKGYFHSRKGSLGTQILTQNQKGLFKDLTQKRISMAALTSFNFPISTSFNHIQQTSPFQMQKSLNKGAMQTEEKNQSLDVDHKLPSIFDSYLKSNPINSNTRLGPNININESSKQVFEQSSIVFDFPSNNFKIPFQIASKEDLKRKFQNKSVKKKDYIKLKESLNEELTNQSEGKRELNDDLDGLHDSLLISQIQHNSIIEYSKESLEVAENMNQHELQELLNEVTCFCCQSKEETRQNHSDISDLIELISTQLGEEAEQNIEVVNFCHYYDQSLKKIIYIRGETFQDQILHILKCKDREIQELSNEVSRLHTVKKDNEILQMKVAYFEEDQNYLKEKLSTFKELQEKISSLESNLLAQKQKINELENHGLVLTSNNENLEKEIESLKAKLFEEITYNKELMLNIEDKVNEIKKLENDNLALKFYIKQENKETLQRNTNVIEKGRRLLEKSHRSNDTNLISKNFQQLEEKVAAINVNRLLAEAKIQILKESEQRKKEEQWESEEYQLKGKTEGEEAGGRQEMGETQQTFVRFQ